MRMSGVEKIEKLISGGGVVHILSTVDSRHRWIVPLKNKNVEAIEKSF